MRARSTKLKQDKKSLSKAPAKRAKRMPHAERREQILTQAGGLDIHGLKTALLESQSRLVKLDRDVRRLRQLIEVYRALFDEYKRAGAVRVTVPVGGENPLLQQQKVRWLVRLTDLMETHFNEAELRDLCFDFGVNYSDVAGETMGDTVRGLATWFERRDTTAVLASRMAELRPSAPWPLSPIEVDTEIDGWGLSGEIGE